MPDPGRESSGFLYSAFALIFLAALSPFLHRFVNLESSRPVERPVANRPCDNLQNVEARLWEDPFEGMERGRRDNIPLRSFETIVRQLSDSGGNPKLDILGVMVSRLRYPASAENRRRSRYAVLSALHVSGYVPRDANRIGTIQNKCGHRPPLIPFEVYEQPKQCCAGTAPILVLWFDEETLGRNPIRELRKTFCGISDGIRLQPNGTNEDQKNESTIRIRLIGPESSTTLMNMMSEVNSVSLSEEVASPGTVPSSSQHASGQGPSAAVSLPSAPAGGNRTTSSEQSLYRMFFEKVEFYSSTATADDSTILGDCCSKEISRTGVQDKVTDEDVTIQDFLAQKLASETNSGAFYPKFLRITPTDRKLARSLVKELEERGLQPPPRDRVQHVVMITERDTVYGRALPQMICREIIMAHPEIVSQQTTGATGCENLRGLMEVYTYPRGLDGNKGESVPSKKDTDSRQDSQTPSIDPDGNAKVGSIPGDLAQGDEQYDYLRRLAEKLLLKNQILHRNDECINAIGVFGTDVYDKLLIIRSLRGLFPGVLFFTTDMDANYMNPKELKNTINLLVSSAFGLELNPDYQKDILPFRSTYQTAQYHAVLMALSKSGVEFTKDYQKNIKDCWLNPIVYEIGRSHAIPISSNMDLSNCMTPSNIDNNIAYTIESTYPDNIYHVHILQSYIITAVFLIILLSTVNPRLFRWIKKNIPTRYCIAIIAIIVIAYSILYICYLLHQTELFFWGEGTSIWPTELIRVTATILSIIFLMYKYISLSKIKQEFSSKYFHLQNKAIPPGKISSESSILLKCTNILMRQIGNDKKDSSQPVEELWKDFLYQSQPSVRAVRILLPSAAFFFAAVRIIRFFGITPPMIRGGFLAKMDFVILIAMILTFHALLFYVLDATKLSTRLAASLANRTTWPEPKRREIRREWKLGSRNNPEGSDPIVDSWLDVQFFARLSEPVTSLIYYPFFVLALIIAALSGLFERWDLPLGLVIVLMISFFIAIYCGISLRRTAEDIRRNNLKVLNREFVKAKSTATQPVPPEQLELLMSMIEKESRGAFAPYSQQPFMRAILLPFGSGSIVAVLQYFLTL